MKRPLLRITLSASWLAASGLAMPAMAAESESGWYAGGNIGIDFPSKNTFSSAGSSNSVTNGYGSGFAGGVSGGYTFENGLRPELEFRYQHAGISSVDVTNPFGSSSPAGHSSGGVSAMIVMANLWYSYKRSDGFFAVVHPYGGGGVGMARLDINDESFSSFAGVSGGGSGSDTALAYQLGFGADTDISSALIASFDVRYLMTSSVSVAGSSSGGGLEGKYRAPSVMVGLKYRFGRYL